MTISEQPQIALKDRQFDQHLVVDRQLFKASAHGTALFEPANTAFNDVASPIAVGMVADRASDGRSSTLLFRWDHCGDPVLSEPMPNPLVTVAAMRSESTWATARTATWLWDANAVEDCLELFRLMVLAWQYQHGERKTLTIAEEVDFGAKAAARST